jgi:hypothetical protein
MVAEHLATASTGLLAGGFRGARRVRTRPVLIETITAADARARTSHGDGEAASTATHLLELSATARSNPHSPSTRRDAHTPNPETRAQHQLEHRRRAARASSASCSVLLAHRTHVRAPARIIASQRPLARTDPDGISAAALQLCKTLRNL